MITAINVVNILSAYIVTEIFVCVMRTLKIYFLSNFHIYNRVVLTTVTMLYITSPRLIYFITGSLYLWTPSTHFTHFPLSTSGDHPSALCIYELVYWFLVCFHFRFHT